MKYFSFTQTNYSGIYLENSCDVTSLTQFGNSCMALVLVALAHAQSSQSSSRASGLLPYLFMPGKMAAERTRCSCQWAHNRRFINNIKTSGILVHTWLHRVCIFLVASVKVVFIFQVFAVFFSPYKMFPLWVARLSSSWLTEQSGAS